MATSEVLPASQSDWVESLSGQLTLDDYLRLRRGLALIEVEEDPPTKRSGPTPVMEVVR